MPALPPAPGVIRVDFHFTRGEDTAAKCRLFFQYTGTAPTNTQLQTFLTAVYTAFIPHMKPLMDSVTIFTLLEMTDLSSSTSAFASGTSSDVGTRGGGTMPGSTALLTSMQVHRRFRGGHGRVYWPFGTQLDLTSEQTWGTTLRTDVDTFIAALTAAIVANLWSGAGGGDLVVPSFYSGFTVHTGTTGRARNVSTPRTSPLIDAVVNVIAREGIAQIRKRLLGLA